MPAFRGNACVKCLCDACISCEIYFPPGENTGTHVHELQYLCQIVHRFTISTCLDCHLQTFLVGRLPEPGVRECELLQLQFVILDFRRLSNATCAVAASSRSARGPCFQSQSFVRLAPIIVATVGVSATRFWYAGTMTGFRQSAAERRSCAHCVARGGLQLAHRFLSEVLNVSIAVTDLSLPGTRDDRL